MRTIRVLIKDGEVSLEANGYVGRTCEQRTEALEKGLGVVVNRIEKPEMYQVCEQENTQEESHG